MVAILHDVMKICHYVQIVRWNRQGYGLEGIRAHTHNTRKAYTNKARIFEHIHEKESERNELSSHRALRIKKCESGAHGVTHGQTTHINTC